MVKKDGVHGFAHNFVSAKRKTEVAYAAADVCMWTFNFDLTNGFNKFNAVVVVLFDPRSDRKNIRVKNDVFRWEIGFLCQ